MTSIVAKAVFSVLSVLAVYMLLMSWHEKDKKVDALAVELNKMYEVLNEKEEERRRDEAAITKRDKAFDEQNKKLSSISRDLNKLAAGSEEMRVMLNMRIPSDLLRGLKTYSAESGTAGGSAAPTEASDRKQVP